MHIESRSDFPLQRHRDAQAQEALGPVMLTHIYQTFSRLRSSLHISSSQTDLTHYWREGSREEAPCHQGFL